MQVENFIRASEIRNRISRWEDYRKILIEKIEQNSEKFIPYGDKETPLRKQKLDIAGELIEKLNDRIDKEIASLELEFTKL